MQRWKSKHPPIKSHKLQRKPPPESGNLEDEENFDECASVAKNAEGDAENSWREIDPDIQRLLSTSNQCEDASHSAKHKRRHQKRDSNNGASSEPDAAAKKCRKKKRAKVIRVSLSKPPSPETIQIIRVDVVSNFSVEELDSTERDVSQEDGEAEDGKRVEVESRKGFLLKCRKLALAARSWDK